MTETLEPQLHPVAITSLRPTQMTVGMREVTQKRAAWHRIAGQSGPAFLGRHMLPVVHGPKQRLYLIDNHHLARALLEERVPEVLVSVVADLSRLEKTEFWSFMDSRNWLHPFDSRGERRSYADLPKTVADLDDDPFRSLAGDLREAGGYSKDNTPYSEFLWADFLRRRIDVNQINEDFDGAVEKAFKLAHMDEARHLPGWCGVERDD